MRRPLAVLALLATLWPHALALECALGGGAHPASATNRHGTARTEADAPERHAHAGAGHAHHGAGQAHDDEHARPGSVPRSGPDCLMVMACALAMIRSQGAVAVAETPSAPEARGLPPLDAPAAAELATDPPPPRRVA